MITVTLAKLQIVLTHLKNCTKIIKHCLKDDSIVVCILENCLDPKAQTEKSF